MEDAENARRMLGNPAVVQGHMGKVLAEYLVEFLPFETETEKMAESVRLVLQPGLVSPDLCLDLWKKSGRRQAYLVGFLQARPDDLPDPVPERADLPGYRESLDGLAAAGNPCARLLTRALSAPGQSYLKTVASVLTKPPTQDVVFTCFETVRDYFSQLRPEGDPDSPIAELLGEAEVASDPGTASGAFGACLEIVPDLRAEVAAMHVLSGLGYGALRPALRDTTAIGSLMRKKLKPVLDPVLEQISVLRGRKR
jgi:hypothetical protein